MQKSNGLSTRAVLAVGLLSLQYTTPQQSYAACALTPGPGNDTSICDSGSSAGLTDLLGNNSLTLPAGGTGTINGKRLLGGRLQHPPEQQRDGGGQRHRRRAHELVKMKVLSARQTLIDG
jgi:hypothetical protein